ncbi:aminotransferase, class V [Caballeronia telluris]|uniref:Aminotransferase, class V n=2 Tax=Caballeronia telluris TaxID=326475 RepID=A0A158KG29_9BURK|nr:aminotransferase, class V [Caballeronia telluris]
MWSTLDAALPGTKRELAAVADRSADEIALNRNSSEGLSTAIFGIPLSADDEVLISAWDYPSVRAAWLQRQRREGIKVVTVDFDVMDDNDIVVKAYEQAISSRTRVMQLTHMLHWTGRVLPVKRLCSLARTNDVITVVDGAQTFAQMPVSFRETDCDFFATSLHKWLGAPVGNGMLIVKQSRIDETWPLLAPFDPPPLRIDKFDHWNLGTCNSAVQAGIAPAIRFREEIGTNNVHARLRELTRYWTTIARDVRGFRLHTPMDTNDLAAVSLFSIDGMDARKIEAELRNTWQVHVKRRSVQGLDGIRVSPHIYMQKSELDVFVEALRQVVKLGSA